MREIPKYFKEQVIFQNESRRTWTEEDSEPVIRGYILDEFAELVEAVELDKPAIEVASEIGDIYYLVIRYLNFTELHGYEDLPKELQEAVDYARDICVLTGLVPWHCLQQKILRNDMKYLHLFANNGFSYQQARNFSKEFWTAQGGDSEFSQLYLAYGEALAQHFEDQQSIDLLSASFVWSGFLDQPQLEENPTVLRDTPQSDLVSE